MRFLFRRVADLWLSGIAVILLHYLYTCRYVATDSPVRLECFFSNVDIEVAFQLKAFQGPTLHKTQSSSIRLSIIYHFGLFHFSASAWSKRTILEFALCDPTLGTDASTSQVGDHTARAPSCETFAGCDGI